MELYVLNVVLSSNKPIYSFHLIVVSSNFVPNTKKPLRMYVAFCVFISRVIFS